MGGHMIVTGASNGLGLALTRALLQGQGEETIVAVDKCISEELNQMNEGNARLTIIERDLAASSDEKASSSDDDFLICTCRKRFGPLRILFNNAAAFWIGPSELVAMQDVRKLFDVNVLAAWSMTRTAVHHMREDGEGGSIVQISSLASRRPPALAGLYAASKAALEALTVSLAKELDPQWKIRLFRAVCGRIQTGARERAQRVSSSQASSLYAHLGDWNDTSRKTMGKETDQTEGLTPEAAAAALIEAIIHADDPAAIEIPIGADARAILASSHLN